MKLPFTIGSRPIQGNFDALVSALGGMRIVRGVVTVSGGTPSITEGVGFSVTDNGVGDYTITLATPFGDVPAVVASGHEWDAIVPIAALAAGSFRIVTYNTTTGANTDSGFNFIAIGP